MPVARKRELTERLQAAREKNGCSFAKRYRTADQIARLADHSSRIEGRDVSPERLREAARELRERE